MAASSSSSLNSTRSVGYCDYKKPLPLKKRTSWTSTNPARRFLTCPNSMCPWKKCKAFHWLDDELDNEWYKYNLYELYSCLNRDQKDNFIQIMNLREMYTHLKGEFDEYKLKMDALVGLLQQESKKSKANSKFYMTLSIVFGCVIVLLLLF